MGKYDYGFDEYLKKLEKIRRETPKAMEAELEKEQRQIRAAYRKRVKAGAKEKPSGRKHLRNGMQPTEVIRNGNDIEAALYNDYRKAPHYHLVERGHDLIRGRYFKKKIGRVRGKYYFRDTIKEMTPKIERQRRRMAYKAFQEVDK